MRAALPTIAAWLVIAPNALAQDARHEDAEFKLWRENGQEVGFILKLTLRPENYKTCQVGLGNCDAAKAGSNHAEKRRAAWDQDKGYLRWVSPLEKELPTYGAKEVEYKVRYGDGNDLKPGDRVDVIAAYLREPPEEARKEGSYWHVFGMTHGPVQKGDQEFTLPGTVAAPTVQARPMGRIARAVNAVRQMVRPGRSPRR